MTSRFPDLVVIGAQKSATRWLRDQLAHDPGLFVAPREVEFFNNHWDEGLSWYAEWFADAAEHQLVVEVTPGYMMFTDDPVLNALRIDGSLPGVRTAAVLRHPVDRAISAFIHHSRAGRLGEDVTLSSHLDDVDPEEDPLGIVSGGWYGRCLEPFVDRFRDRLLVLKHEDVRDEPGALLHRVAAHVGIDNLLIPPTAGDVQHSNRAHVDEGVVERAMLDDAQRARVWDRHFASDHERLQALVDLEVSHWSHT